MTDSVVHKFERELREDLSFHATCDKPDREQYDRWMRKLADIRMSIQRQDELKLQTLIERLTGCRP